MQSAALALSASAGLLAMVALGGCETTVEQSNTVRPMPAKPTPPPPTPAGALANNFVLLLLTPKAIDSDGDGRPDTMGVECYLFAEPFPSSLWESGTFVFALHRPGESGVAGSRPLAEWRFGPEIAAAARARTLIGVCYRFALNLAEADRGAETGRTDIGLPSADLTGRFEPADGRGVIRTTGVRAVQFVGS
ncbi:MAG TPA: hypothetical protein PKC43_08230 [Phycisphaerales bacterium]|nr:hypothetical protein [Phycisphaerales bacterium]HMP37423.1 hypothetical protein [Phycisphaerales bacterium]